MREDIASYLRSVGSLYPGGIPRSMIGNRVAAPSAKPAAKEKRVAFLWLDPTFSDSASPLADAAGQLLQAAIEKGLKLPLSDALVVRTSNPDVLHAALNSPAAGVFVVLGDKTAAAALDCTECPDG